jgi:hypothetical protein
MTAYTTKTIPQSGLNKSPTSEMENKSPKMSEAAQYQNKPFIQRQIKPENIKVSEVKILGVKDRSSTLDVFWKGTNWPTQFAGHCMLQWPALSLYSNGWCFFIGNLSSSESDDSWGILHFDFLQDNGLVLWSSGSFWSPTIGTFGTWRFQFTYPEYLFDTIKSAQFASHC